MGPLPLIHLRWTVPLVLPWDHSICSPLRPFPPIIHGTIPPVPLVAIPPFASKAFLHIPTWVCPKPGPLWDRSPCYPWDRSSHLSLGPFHLYSLGPFRLFPLGLLDDTHQMAPVRWHPLDGAR